MMKPLAQYENPEPVPSVSQLCALPFVAAIAGYLTETAGCEHARVTLHRVMNRDKQAFLQQICSYAGSALDHTKAGRIFAVSVGIIGKAFSERMIVRTRFQASEVDWWSSYRADRKEVGDTSAEVSQVLSYLAVPLLNAEGDDCVCVLYAEASGLNVFAAEVDLRAILGMCEGYCRVIDGLANTRLPRIRNYPLPVGTPINGNVTAYPRLQEAMKIPQPPRFRALTSFNFAPTM